MLSEKRKFEMARNYRNEALENVPSGYAVLGAMERVKPNDLVWSWSSKEWLRADSPDWLQSSFLVPFEELICVVRKPEMTEFEKSVPRRKFYLVRRK